MINIFKKFKNSIHKYFFPFFKKEDLKELFKILEENKDDSKEVAMFVGGCVRNHLKFEKVKDIDIATVFSPEEIKKKFDGTKFKLIETGIDHGSLTLVNGKNKYELTTLRKDIITDGRHAEIEKINNWREDSNRRDFTINSIYLNIKGKIFDPQNGLSDLNNNVVKFIGDPQKRIQEDYLRIIRFIRFSIQYEAEVDISTIQAIKLNLNGIKNISKERIFNELLKILKLKNFYKINYNNNLQSIFLLIFPEIKYLNRIKYWANNEDVFNLDIANKLAILTLDDTDNYEYFCHKYKTSKAMSNKFAFLANCYKDYKRDKQFFDQNLKKNLYFYGKETLQLINLINQLSKKNNNKKDLFIDIKNKIKNTNIPTFPFNGDYLKKRGLKEGAILGKILKQIEKDWLKGNFTISDKKIEEIISNQKIPFKYN